VQGKHISFPKPRHIYLAAVGISLFLLLHLGFQLIRETTEDQRFVPFEDTMSSSLNKTRVTAIGSPVVFSQWLKDEWWNFQEPRWGASSFGAVFEWLGIGRRSAGQDLERISIGQPDDLSNVYTMFRGLIEDVTLPGSFFALFFIGVFAGLAYRKLESGQHAWLICLAFFYAITLSGHNRGVFIYTSTVVGMALFAGLFLLLDAAHPLDRRMDAPPDIVHGHKASLG
jgi:oligosaccharide repeat unit polymerase